MDRKQKERLRFYLKARKRAEQVLAARRAAEQQKLEYQQRKEASQDLQERYTEQLTALAQECGVMALAEAAARERAGSLTCRVSFYLDYGIASSHLQHAIGLKDQAVLRASHMVLAIRWDAQGTPREAEIRVYPKGYITFHNSFVPVYPFVWRRFPGVLRKMLEWALAHPTDAPAPVKEKE